MQVTRYETSGPQPGETDESDLESEPFIEVNEEVRDKAYEIVGSVRDKREQAYLLFRWVRDNIKYKYPPKVSGNLATLHSRRGDCGESSFLFVSLCRALGIPARVVFGRIVGEDGKTTPHAWAEAYMGGWLSVDCSIARDVKKPLFSTSDYFGIPHDPEYYFGNLDDKRLVYSIGTGIDPEVEYPKGDGKGYRIKTQDGDFFWWALGQNYFCENPRT